MKRRAILVSAFLAAALSAPAWGPRVLRHLDPFSVRRVEISGTRLLAPHEVLAASGIRAGQSVWDDAAARERILEEHSVITAATVRRVLPHTLRVRIKEMAPVALVDRGALRLATADGVMLPVDPARAALDLPLVRRSADASGSATTADSVQRRLLAEIGRIAGLHPGLAARISEVAPGPTGAMRLVLSRPQSEVLLPWQPDVHRLRELQTVLEYLERRASHGARLDLRWNDQVVVRVSPSVG